jgi:hypothetical protein
MEDGIEEGAPIASFSLGVYLLAPPFLLHFPSQSLSITNPFSQSYLSEYTANMALLDVRFTVMVLLAFTQVAVAHTMHLTRSNSTEGSPLIITIPTEAPTFLSLLSPYLLHLAITIAVLGFAYCKRELIAHQAAWSKLILNHDLVFSSRTSRGS